MLAVVVRNQYIIDSSGTSISTAIRLLFTSLDREHVHYYQLTYNSSGELGDRCLLAEGQLVLYWYW